MSEFVEGGGVVFLGQLVLGEPGNSHLVPGWRVIGRCGFFLSSADTLKGKIIYEFFKYTQAQVDSVQTEALKSLKESVSGLKDNVMNQYYELYPTENMWTFLELNTCFGSIRQVQYTVKDDDNYRFKLSISSDDLRESGFSLYRDKIIPGRFALYKTQNMYNFILLDKVDGRTWQVQWGMDAKDRQIIPIK